MINIRTLKQKINLLEYIQKTLKSVECININKRSVLKKQDYLWKNLYNIFFHLKNLLEKPMNKPKILLVIGSDSSLCGSYNNSIVKYFENHKNDYSQYENIFIIGKKLKKISSDEKIKKYNYKNFFNDNGDNLYNTYGFNIDILGYHSKEISVVNIFDRWTMNNNFNDNNENFNGSLMDESFILEGDNLSKTYEILLFEYLILSNIYSIEVQENLQRLVFLKSAIDNCQEEIKTSIKNYRSIRQETITREINELISSNL